MLFTSQPYFVVVAVANVVVVIVVTYLCHTPIFLFDEPCDMPFKHSIAKLLDM